MRNNKIFIVIILMFGILPIFADEPDKGLEVMQCEYCNSVDMQIYLKDGKFYGTFELSPDILKMGTVSWHKILKKVRESEKYKNIHQTIRFLPFPMPENGVYRPDVYTEIVKDWRANTTICLVLYKCIFVMSHDVAKNMLWQLKGESTSNKITIELVLNTPDPGQGFYCFFPLMKKDEEEQEDVAANDAKEYLLLTVSNRGMTITQGSSAQEILQQTEITIDGWVPTPSKSELKDRGEVWVPNPRRGGFGGSDDYEGKHFEPKEGISTVK